MHQDEFEKLFHTTVEQLNHLLIIKGGEYAGSEDRLANFKRGAQLTGTTSLQCLFIYMSKHYDAIATYIRDDAVGRDRMRSEPIEGRVDDLINYGILLKALLAERSKYAVMEKQKEASQEPLWNGSRLAQPPRRTDVL